MRQYNLGRKKNILDQITFQIDLKQNMWIYQAARRNKGGEVQQQMMTKQPTDSSARRLDPAAIREK